MQYSRINGKRMKKINMQSVLNSIRKYKSISRKDLAKVTRLTTGTITNLTDDLIKNGLILEQGSGESEGGRKPIFLELNKKAGYAVGLELNTWMIVCALSDFKGDLIDKCHSELHDRMSEEDIIVQMSQCIEDILLRNKIKKEKVIGIGLAVPGPYNDEEAIMENPPNFKGWSHVQICEMIQQRTGIKTYGEKETNSALLGEYWFGKLADHKRVFEINIYELGIGGGFFTEGAIFHSNKYCSMEIGHTLIDIHGPVCRCGSAGCLEVLANGLAAINYAKQMVEEGRKSVLTGDFTFDALIEAAQQGDAVANDAIQICADYIGIALINVIGLLDPDALVFGGDFIDKSDLLFQKICAILEKKHPYFLHSHEIKKIKSSFGIYAGAIGGIATVLNHISQYNPK